MKYTREEVDALTERLNELFREDEDDDGCNYWVRRVWTGSLLGTKRTAGDLYRHQEYDEFVDTLAGLAVAGVEPKVLMVPLRRVPLFVNNRYPAFSTMAAWRLSIGK